MRLNRFLARSGVASRRAADTLIADGRVAVNGTITTKLSTTVDPAVDAVEVDGRPVRLPDAPTYIMLNKPRGYVVTRSDPQGRPTVADLVAAAGSAVVPVGRLDARTEGLLILTDDGDLAYRVTHPSYELDKVYEVVARGVLSQRSRHTLEKGVELDGRLTAPARVTVRSTDRNTTVAEMVIHEGRKRQVRRMFEAVGHPVRRLKRVAVGPIKLGHLRPGKWRHLTEQELRDLRRALGLPEG
jgi:23S rRNA pseudouridine2605 synthase